MKSNNLNNKNTDKKKNTTYNNLPLYEFYVPNKEAKANFLVEVPYILWYIVTYYYPYLIAYIVIHVILWKKYAIKLSFRTWLIALHMLSFFPSLNKKKRYNSLFPRSIVILNIIIIHFTRFLI